MKNLFAILLIIISVQSFSQTYNVPVKTGNIVRLRNGSTTVSTAPTATATDSIYQFVLTRIKKSVVTPPPPVNQAPIARAGNDISIVLPLNTVTLNGSGSTDDSGIVSYSWAAIAGTGAFISSPNSAITVVQNLTVGTYTFRLTVTDAAGLTGTDDINVVVNNIPPPPPTFLIEGFGSGATGGKGYQTIHITDLSQLKSQIGSNRTILIDVSGTINGNLYISNVSNLTIDAYSTKQDVTITSPDNDGVSVENSNNVIIRGLRSINNGTSNSDGLNAVGSSKNVVFDHCSAYGNTDGNIDLTATTGGNFTVQWCIMGNSKQSGNQLITTSNASAHHNLYIGDGIGEGAERNPFAHASYSPVDSPNVDFRNNLVNASGRYATGTGWNATGNFVNNYYVSNQAGLINLCSDKGHCGSGYVSGNFNQPNSTGGTRVSTEYTIPPQYKITTTDAITAAQAVLQNVGPFKRDAYEQAAINSIVIGTTPPPTACTGYIYSAWSACTNGVQTRTVTGYTPGGCTGTPTTQPVLTQSCTVTPPPTGYTLTYQNDFNVASDINSNQLGRGSLSTTQSVSGGASFRSEVRAGDAPISSGWRSEQQYEGANQNPTEGAVEYDVFYENWGNFDGGGHSVQWHPNTSGGSAIISLQNYSSTWDVTRDQCTNCAVIHQSNAPSHLSNRWYNLRWEFKWSTGSDGYVRLFVDGVQTFNFIGATADGSGQYFKLGQNRWPSGSGNMQTTSVCYYDNLKIYTKN
jgi:hypothetical protein